MLVRGTYIGYLLGPPVDGSQRTDRIEQLNGFALSQEYKWGEWSGEFQRWQCRYAVHE